MRPFAYIVLLSTIYYLVALMAGQNTWIDDLISGFMLGAQEKDSEAEVPQLVSRLTDNYAYLTLILLPVFSLGSYLCFKRFGKNYFEHVVVNSFITGHQAGIYSIFTCLSSLIKSDIVAALSFVVAISYTFWSFWQLFNKGNRLINLLSTLLTYLIYLFLLSIIGLGVVALSGIT